jgi:hypothetical protein
MCGEDKLVIEDLPAAFTCLQAILECSAVGERGDGVKDEVLRLERD